MLVWSHDLYVGESIRSKQKRIIRKLDSGKKAPGHFLVTLALNEKDYLDLMDTAFLSQKAIRDHLPMIVGIAGSRREAMKLVVAITEECLKETGNADLRRFLIDRETALSFHPHIKTEGDR